MASTPVMIPERESRANGVPELTLKRERLENAGPPAASATCRILVVDDNQDAADSLAALLRMQGNQVYTAHDGLEAVSTAAALKPDIVLLDIGMPRLNGFEAGRRIREQQGPKLVLIAVTGWGQEEDRRRAEEAGFDRHIIKPVEIDDLQRIMSELRTEKYRPT